MNYLKGDQVALLLAVADIIFPEVCEAWGNPDLGRTVPRAGQIGHSNFVH